ncbi:MAG: hypothetical protein KF763_15635 [Cyclobacteriaceae bacterium]|nr:hypothetical protein [Cyclobacteriaceae bacterium]
MMNAISLRPHVEQLRELMLAHITEWMAQQEEVSFADGKKLGSAREIIDGLVMKGDEVFVITKDQATAEGLYHDLDDERFVLLEDLLWIYEQLQAQAA